MAPDWIVQARKKRKLPTPGPTQEKKSFAASLDKAQAYPPDQALRKHFPEVGRKLGPVFESLIPGKIQRCELSSLPKVVRSLFHTLKRDSSPGVPLMYEFSKNQNWLEADPERIVAEVVARAKARVSFIRGGASMKASTPEEVLVHVNGGLIDPARVFVKNEPYEFQRKEPRIVCSVSVIDSLLERLIYGADLEHSLSFWMIGYQSIGITLGQVGNIEAFRTACVNRMVSRQRTMMSSDISGFEFSLYAEILEAGCEVICYRLFHKQLKDLNVEDDFECLALADFQSLLGCSSYMFSDGTVVASIEPRVDSGMFKTAIIDSICRSLLASFAQHIIKYPLVDLDKLVYTQNSANGDDNVESVDVKHADANMQIDAYRRLGFGLKEVFFDRQEIQYCSQLIKPGTHYPEAVDKTTLSLLSNKAICENLFDQYATVNSRYPEWVSVRDYVISVIDRVSSSVVSAGENGPKEIISTEEGQ